MRFATLLPSILLLNTFVYAQSETEVRQTIKAYTQELIDGNWQKSLDYTYPALFTMMPKEAMISQINETFSDTSTFVISFNDMTLESISEIHQDSTNNYSFVTYNMKMSLRVVDNIDNSMVSTLHDGMIGTFGEEQVELKGRTIVVSQANKMAAIKNRNEEKVYLLEIKSELSELYPMFMTDNFTKKALDFLNKQ